VAGGRVLEGESRVSDSGISVLSDAAASCILSRHPTDGGFRLKGLSSVQMAQLGATPRDQLHRATRNVAAVVASALGGASLTRADIDHVVVSNLRPGSRRFLIHAAGFGDNDRTPPELAAIGHCFAADPFVSLGYMVDNGHIAIGDTCLLIMRSTHVWGAAVLERVAPEPRA
jgi:3-oxoacyl-[acyl-carrier-protein] synthase III